jgi:hypothetical protein
MTRHGRSSWGRDGEPEEIVNFDNPITDEELALRKAETEPFDAEKDFKENRDWYRNDVRNEKAKMYHDCIDHPDLMARRDAILLPESYAEYRACVSKVMELIADIRKRHN